MTEQEWLNIFAGNLIELMHERGYSQGDLAEESGLDESSISRYINQRRLPSIRAIINIAYTLDCNVDELIDFGDRIEG
mgnify:CR=1 FL=1